MINASELIGKKLVCLNTAGIFGTVVNLIFDSKLRTARFLQIFSEDEAEPELQYAAFKSVKHFEFDACVIADKSAISYEWNTHTANVFNPINRDCFNQSGKLLGRVRDIVLDGCSIKTVLIDELEFSPALLLSYSEQALIFNDTGKPIRLIKKNRGIPKNTGTSTVSVHRAECGASAPLSGKPISRPFALSEPPMGRDIISLPLRVPPEKTSVSRSPSKENGGGVYAFLLGKSLSRPLKDERGSILVQEKSTVTEDVIQTARQHGKLVQLALYVD